MTLYEILGVSAQATAAEIKAAHRDAVKAHHPDAGGDPADFVRAQRAYAILSDPKRRARYDSTGSEDDASAAEEQQAYAAIAALVLQIVDGAEDLNRMDVIAAVRLALREQERAHQLARARVGGRLDRIAVLRNRLSRNDPGDDGLATQITAREVALEAARTSEVDKLRIIGRAIELLSHYSYSLDPTAPEEAAIWSALKNDPASPPGARAKRE